MTRDGLRGLNFDSVIFSAVIADGRAHENCHGTRSYVRRKIQLLC